MLDRRRIQLLRAVVISGSLTAAARNLGYTPSAISQQIAVLEKEAGITLLERTGRGVRPTEAGQMLTDHAAVIDRHFTQAETELAELRAGRTGRVAVRYFATAGAALVAPAVAALRREQPGIQVELKLSDPNDPLPELRSRQADLALVVRSPHQLSADGIRFVHLLDDRYSTVLPMGHPLAAKPELDLTDLADQPWIGSDQPGPCLEPVLDACASAGFSPNFVVESGDYDTAQAFVAAGLGISLIPEMGLAHHHPAVVTRPVRNPEPVRTIYAAVRDPSPAQPAVHRLIDTLRESARLLMSPSHP
ncbi:LysR family transcriptional regulator [Streptomyces lushanensis]|uniref:LysR family transcriptional regulator n=1 Tax=Streptomyces lushanensis TaxID=1434255 RepID=UPI000829C3B4|nr:LysR family transcriptional regulator [Streptomyces lushanensis]